MRNFRDYCNQSLISFTVDEVEKSSILSKCMDENKNQSKLLKAKINLTLYRRIAIAATCILFISIISINHFQTINKLEIFDDKTTVKFNNGIIYFINTEDNPISESKIVEPSGSKQKWSYEKVCRYMGKDISLPYVPKNLEFNSSDTEYTIYINENNEVTYDNIELLYQSKDNSSYIDVILSKEKLPITDVLYSGNTNSYINDTNIKMSKIGSNTYRAEFLYDNIGYIINSNLGKEEFTNVLRSIVG